MLDALRNLGVHWERRGESGYLSYRWQAGNFGQAELFWQCRHGVSSAYCGLALCQGVTDFRGVVADVDGLRELAPTSPTSLIQLPQPLAPRIGAPGDHLRTTVRGDVSSQFLTALLMALPLTGHAATIALSGELISKPYIEITLNLLARFGVAVQRRDWAEFFLPADQTYHSPGMIQVEGDASSASYFLAAGAIGGGPVRVHGVGKASIR
jgi:3-phosphoshikimate 1-carboxyvinyltransferase